MKAATEIPTDAQVESGLWTKVWIIGAIMAVAGLGLWATNLGGALKDRAYLSYLFAYASVWTMVMGAMGFVLIQHLVRAGWSVVVRRVAEFAMVTIPVFAVLFVPIAMGSHDLYHWTHVESLDPVLKAKAPYLNMSGFYIRAVVYFVAWSALAWFFYTKSVKQDEGGEDEQSRSLMRMSALAIPVFGLTLTFAGFDWLMSLQPHWYSTIWGIYIFAGGMTSALSLMTLVLMGLQRAGYIQKAVTTEHYHDLGKLLFGFTVFWAYIAFSQFVLQWYAGIPEETEFYLARLHHGDFWEKVSYAMPITHFFLPFFFLVSRHMKRKRLPLALGAVWALIVHVIDIYWLVMPNFRAHGLQPGTHPEHFHMHFMDFASLIGVVGVFLAVFGFFLKSKKVVPVGDPRIIESMAHENF